jgi:hypothetical protein
MDRPPTVSEILKRNATPKYDVRFATDGPDKGAVFIGVTGVKVPFSLKINAVDVIGSAPFGRVTKEHIMRLAQETAQQACREKGYI